MKSKLETLLARLALVGIFVLPIVLLIAISIPGKVAGWKQVAMDRAQASLLVAFNDIHPASSEVGFASKQYGYFVIYSCTNVVMVEGRSYQCALATAPWDNQYYSHGRLAITTNQEIIWLDDRHGAKLIPVDYQVSKWRSGY